MAEIIAYNPGGYSENIYMCRCGKCGMFFGWKNITLFKPKFCEYCGEEIIATKEVKMQKIKGVKTIGNNNLEMLDVTPLR